MLAIAKTYLEKSERLQFGSPFAAARILVAADALIRAVKHQQDLAQKEGPPPPNSAEITHHVDRVYFRCNRQITS